MSGSIEMDRSTLMLTAAAPVAVAVLLSAAGVEGEIIGVLAGTAGTLVPALRLRRNEESKSREEKVLEAQNETTAVNPLVLGLMAASLLVLIEFLAGYYVGVIMGWTLGIAGERDYEIRDYLSVLMLAVVPLMLLAVPIGRELSLRVGQRPKYWIAVSIGASRLLSVLLYLAFTGERLEPGTVIPGQAIVGVLLLVPALIGHWWAERTRKRYTLRRLFRALDNDEADALLEQIRAQVGPAPSQAPPQAAQPPHSSQSAPHESPPAQAESGWWETVPPPLARPSPARPRVPTASPQAKPDQPRQWW